MNIIAIAQIKLILNLKKKIKIYYQEKEVMDIGFGNHISY
jgi:hypothetical protein